MQTFKRQFYTEQMFVLVSMNILRLSFQAEFLMNYKLCELLK